MQPKPQEQNADEEFVNGSVWTIAFLRDAPKEHPAI